MKQILTTALCTLALTSISHAQSDSVALTPGAWTYDMEAGTIIRGQEKETTSFSQCIAPEDATRTNEDVAARLTALFQPNSCSVTEIFPTSNGFNFRTSCNEGGFMNAFYEVTHTPRTLDVIARGTMSENVAEMYMSLKGRYTGPCTS